PPYMLVEGNPSRVRSLNLVGLKRNNLQAPDLADLKQAFRILYRSGLRLSQALEKLHLLADNEHVQRLEQFLQLSQSEGRRGLIPGKRVKDEA
ncbi:MAG TPA: hypothetical protein V6D12_24680, partial [Candidatus Obscuribacterales bacterium]